MAGSKYNMDSLFRESYPLTLHDLCMEISEEYDEEHFLDEDTIRKKFHNSRKTGVYDHLKEDLKFDFQKISNLKASDDEEKHAKLKLLKLLYQYEKKQKIVITAILAQPRMTNINTDYTDFNQYGEYIEELTNKIELCVPDVDERLERYKKMYWDWQVVFSKLMDFVTSDRALEDGDAACEVLNKIKQNLDVKTLDDNNEARYYSSEGVMVTFYNFLRNYWIKCFDGDMKDKSFNLESTKEMEQYCLNYKKMEKVGLFISWDILCLLEEVVLAKECDFEKIFDKWEIDTTIRERTKRELIILQYLITYGETITDKDEKYYKVAFKYCKTLVGWWLKEAGESMLDCARWDVIVPAIQEIFYAQKNNVIIRMPYRGNKHANKSMLSQLKLENAAEAIVKEVWIQRLKTRCAYNFGCSQQMKLVEEIKKILYRYKEYIFSFIDLKDIELAHTVIWHTVKQCLENKLEKKDNVDEIEIKKLHLEMFL